MTDERKAEQADRETYEAPTLMLLGSAGDLTAGPNGGPDSDLTYPHHTSGA